MSKQQGPNAMNLKDRVVEFIEHPEGLRERNVEKILATTMIKGRLAFVIEWDSFPDYEGHVSVVAASLLNEIMPDFVIKFYEEKLTFRN